MSEEAAQAGEERRGEERRGVERSGMKITSRDWCEYEIIMVAVVVVVQAVERDELRQSTLLNVIAKPRLKSKETPKMKSALRGNEKRRDETRRSRSRGSPTPTR